VFECTVALIEALRATGRKIACVSSSKNCRPVLGQAELTSLFDAIVDRNDLVREKLAGKPASDTYLRAAALLAAEPGGRGHWRRRRPGGAATRRDRCRGRRHGRGRDHLRLDRRRA
jgi:hypothetical protein